MHRASPIWIYEILKEMRILYISYRMSHEYSCTAFNISYYTFIYKMIDCVSNFLFLKNNFLTTGLTPADQISEVMKRESCFWVCYSWKSASINENGRQLFKFV